MRTVSRKANRVVSIMAMAGFLAVAPGVGAQPAGEAENAKIWVGRAAEYEDFLRTAEIARMEDNPVGVTKPQRAYFAPGGLVESMSWKAIKPGRYKGFWESYRSEIAAYELDKLLDMQMIPPTVEKRVKGDLGAAIMWVKPVKTFKDLGGAPTPPGQHMERWNKQMVRAKMFHNLIANKDPNMGNWLVDPAWNLILIDHTRAFVSDKEMIHKMQRVDREFWDRMKAVTEESLTAALGNWLDKGQIKNILERRARLEQEIAKLVTANGESAIFIP